MNDRGGGILPCSTYNVEHSPPPLNMKDVKPLSMYSGTSLERGPWDYENYLVISGFSLYQGKKTKKYKELGPPKLPC